MQAAGLVASLVAAYAYITLSSSLDAPRAERENDDGRDYLAGLHERGRPIDAEPRYVAKRGDILSHRHIPMRFFAPSSQRRGNGARATPNEQMWSSLKAAEVLDHARDWYKREDDNYNPLRFEYNPARPYHRSVIGAGATRNPRVDHSAVGDWAGTSIALSQSVAMKS